MPKSSARASASVESDGKPIVTEDSTATDKPETKTKTQQEMENALFTILEKFMAPREPRLDTDAWSKLADEVWTYENVRVKRWRNEINTLLVFAGLFSAVLTEFVGQYYAVLAPPPDYSTRILEHILSSQLGSMTTDSVVSVTASSSSARTAGALADTSLTGIPSSPAAPRWIATLWFMSLVLSLSAASIALAVNQWLNFHAEQAGLRSAAQKLWTWQLRRDALNKWKVEFIVSLLPCLLQVALVLFLIGIVGYLWVLGTDIAVPSAVFITLLFLFLIATSLLPALVTYSPYKSPQAWWLCQAGRRIQWPVTWLLRITLSIYVDVYDICTLRADPESHWILRGRIRNKLWSLRRRSRRIIHRIKSPKRCFEQVSTIILERWTVVQGRAIRWFRDVPTRVSQWDLARDLRLKAWSTRSVFNTHLVDLKKLMETSDWLGHEQLCLRGSTAHRSEETLFADVYSIALDTDVIRAIQVCSLKMPARLAVDSVVKVGEARFKALSTREFTARSRKPESIRDEVDRVRHDDPFQYDDPLQYDTLDGTVTALIGRMLLSTFHRAKMEQDEGIADPFDSPSNRRVLAALIRGMPLTDGMATCMSLFQHLDAPQSTVEFRRAILDVIQRVYLTVDFLAEDTGYVGQDLVQTVRPYECAPRTALYRLRNLRDWERIKHAFNIVYEGGDTVSIIQNFTIIVAVCIHSVGDKKTMPAQQTTGTELDDMLTRVERHLTSLGHTEMQEAVRNLPPEATYRLDWTFYWTPELIGSLVMDGKTRQLSLCMSMNRILRRLQWLLKCDDWTPQGTAPGFRVRLGLYAYWTREHLQEAGIDTKNLEGPIPCREDEADGQGNPPGGSQQAASGPPQDEDAQHHAPEPRTDAPTRQLIPRVVRDAWRRRKCSTARGRARDVELGLNETAMNTLPNVSELNDNTADGEEQAVLRL
ncbi:hypothetical protein EVJ58_g8596 [Rhodofomes roseus]|uniref:DUF6535 domain-containing protein n=1 Tax=Rhodofomes roseus TaxID=34475 RepID=A0A4Y9XXJ7_9APHY|nr:hypothetical protein EVJ58_g8596 [Rhodofomes roseus]